jgi:putative redox protein
MVQMTGIYQGYKHCELKHGPSGATIATDAPKDNNGKGEAFSPTDLVSIATGSCMMTVIAIHAERESVSIEGSHMAVKKEMQPAPRKISRITIELHLPQHIPIPFRQKFENAALNCPVKNSLNPDIEVPVSFIYDV